MRLSTVATPEPMPFRHMAAVLLAGAFLALGGARANSTELPPIEQFFKEAEFANARLSPDGRHLAAIVRLEGAPQARNIVVMDVDTRATKAITGYEEEDVRNLTWVNADRLMFNLDRSADEANRASQYLGTFSVLKDGSGGAPVRQRDARSRLGAAVAGSGTAFRYLSRLPNDDKHVLMVGGNELFVFPNVYRCNVADGKLRKVMDNKVYAYQWVPDNQGVIRAALTAGEVRDDLEQALIYRVDEDADWVTLRTFHQGELTLFGFDQDDQHLFVSMRDDSTRQVLYRVNLSSGEFGEPLVTDEVYDVSQGGGELRRTHNGKAVFYTYMADKPRTVFFDEHWEGRQAKIDQALAQTVNEIVSWSDDETRFLVYAHSDRDPGAYYLFDDKQNKLTYLLSPRSWIDPQQMRPMQPVSYPARDGMRMHGYLTLPASGDSDKPPPLIVHPHGGPFGPRDVWGFDPDVQFLANRGYAVLQVNFRGSGGFGGRHLAAGYRRWGLEMQDDLTDGVLWAAEQGLIDPGRVCIYGASYGGYATMMGVVKTPELYKCGINYVGVVDLGQIIKETGRTFNVTGLDGPREAWLNMTIGDPVEHKQRFYDTSPINHVERITAPLLLVHGAKDGIVNIEHFRRLTGKLKRHNKKFEALVKRSEGHGFNASENQVELYTAIEKFLAEHL